MIPELLTYDSYVNVHASEAILNDLLKCLCLLFPKYVYEGGPQNPEFIYKTLCTYSYMFKLQSPSMHSPFDATHLP